MLDVEASATPENDDTWLPTVCWLCVEGPDVIRVHRVNGVAVNIEGNMDFRTLSKGQGRMCLKALSMLQKLYNPYRIKSPLKRTNPTKGKGVDPKWVKIGWDEALDIVAEKLKKIREVDTRRLCVCPPGPKECSHNGTFDAFFDAFGPVQMSGGGGSVRCDMAEHVFGNHIHGGFQCEPDLTYCNYLIMIGENTSASGGAPETVLYSDARARGMKMVVVDPVFTLTAAKAEQWLPIRPCTDSAFLLALIHVVLHELCVYDAPFLKKVTNSPYLVGDDGYFMRDEASKKVLVWDLVDSKAKPYDDASIKDFALEGIYSINGVEGKPAFQVLKDHMKQYTPEWASAVTDIPADTIRGIAKEFADHAQIGSTITIEGVTLPLRPVAIKLGRGVTGNMRSYQAILANHILAALVGALEVPGGHGGGRREEGNECNQGIIPGPDGMLKLKTHTFTWPPLSLTGAEVLIPFGKSYPGCNLKPLVWRNLVDPPKHFPVPAPPEAFFIYRCNPLMSVGEPEVVSQALRKAPFVVSISYLLDEIAELADVVLPEHTDLERFDLSTVQRDATAKKYAGVILRQPIVEPLHNTMELSEILTELADRAGFLEEYNMAINALGQHRGSGITLTEDYKLDPKKKYSWVEIVDRACKSATNGEHDLQWFRKNGAKLRPVSVEEQYDVHLEMMAKQLRHPIPYMELVKRTGEELAQNLRKIGIDWWPTSEYVPLPVYVPPILETVPMDYDLYVTTCRLPQYTFASNAECPWELEVSENVPGQGGDIIVNAGTASERGIKDGDEVWIESDVGKVKGRVRLSEGIRPDTLLIPAEFGHWATPVARDTKRASLTPLTPIRHSWIDPVVGCMQGITLKAKVYKSK
ncbi:MAG: molybdopterin-dependent oxidoreductase [Deltaproteobacteria bacterium]|nr:MAG: molybdopterin-dependent oxidoreductase [Deltaproteobacteria bacterium]